MNKNLRIYIVLLSIVLVIILFIFYIKNLNRENLDYETVKCISEKATMYSQTTCPHCMFQKQVFKNYLELLKIVECDKEVKKCDELGIRVTPTWVIDNKKFEGVKTIEELKNLTGC